MTQRADRPTAPADPAANEAAERYVIPNLRNACRILKTLGQAGDGAKVGELSRQLGIPTTTTLRIMNTLHLEGLVRKDDGRYLPGPVLIHLGQAALAGTEIRAQALPVLQSLTDATMETSHLAIPCNRQTLIVAVQDSPHPLRAASRPGFLGDLHCSATGKILLAYTHRNHFDEVMDGVKLTRRTQKTINTLKQLQREMEVTRQRGYSLDDEEFNPGVRCLAAPIFDATGACVAAIGITAATVRFTVERIPEVAEQVRAAARTLSAKLGYV